MSSAPGNEAEQEEESAASTLQESLNDDAADADDDSGSADPRLRQLLEFLKRTRGFDFTGYKRPSLARRFRKRMKALDIDDYAEYQRFLEQNPSEFTYLINTVLINVTAFFRDGSPWDVLKSDIIPSIIERKPPDFPIRVWSAGCATGQEAYTLAIVLSEVLGLERFRERVKIYATDVDDEALDFARTAIYSERDTASLTEEMRNKYFEKVDNRFAFRKDLRRSVIFGRNDLIQDAPISKIDLLVSRNTLMYFDAATQTRILARFHFALNDGGFLLLGRAETLLTHTDTFTPVDLKSRIFTTAAHTGWRNRMNVARDLAAPTQPREAEPHSRLRSSAFDAALVAQIIVDRTGCIAAVNERARVMFGLTLSDVGRPLQDLEMSYRPVELRSLIDHAYAERYPITRTDIAWTGGVGDVRWLSLQIVPVFESGAVPAGVAITFTDITTYKRLHEELESSNHELEAAFEELQSASEELETTNEELQSTVEELETTNEELHSTNEELETMNEELQSTNEEIQTVSDEASRRGDELNEANAFLEAVFTSLRGGVVVLDNNMQVLVWNDQAEELWGLRREEAVGAYFLNLDIGLPVDTLRAGVRAVLSGSTPATQHRVEAVNRRGKPIECAIQITPLLSPSGDEARAVRGAILVMDQPPLGQSGQAQQQQ